MLPPLSLLYPLLVTSCFHTQAFVQKSAKILLYVCSAPPIQTRITRNPHALHRLNLQLAAREPLLLANAMRCTSTSRPQQKLACCQTYIYSRTLTALSWTKKSKQVYILYIPTKIIAPNASLEIFALFLWDKPISPLNDPTGLQKCEFKA